MQIVKGIKTPAAKLTELEVIIIKQRLEEFESCVSISKDFNVTPGTINAIKQGKIWDFV